MYNTHRMTVFFTCSIDNILKYSQFYLETRDSVLSLGHYINRDWINYSIELAKQNKPDPLTSSIYEDVMSAILTSDLVIADATVRSMTIGHQVTFALQKKKPVLLLSYKEDLTNPSELFVSGAKSPLLQIKSYSSLEEIKTVIKSFLQKYESTPKTRFNLVLNKAQDSYIEWASFTYKKSKTDIIQQAITEKMENDKGFEKYIDL